MKIEKGASDLFIIEIARDDLRIINNCINDAIDLISSKEFGTRVGATLEEAEALLDIIQGALRKPG